MGLTSVESKASSLAAFMNMLKSNVGTGVLSMPIAFSHAGWLLGLVTLPIFALFCTHAMFLLINAQKHICRKFSSSALSYEEVTEKAFSIGPQPLRPYARFMTGAVSFFLTSAQVGISTAYVLFVCESIKKIISDFLPDVINIHLIYFIMILFPVMALLNQIRTMKYLAVASATANTLQAIGLVLLFVNLVQDIPSIEDRRVINFSKFPLYFGTAVFSFEGISVVLPVRDSMRRPEQFDGVFGILSVANIVTVILYMFLGTLGYFKYGDTVHGTITVDLPKNIFYEADRLLFAVAVFLSYPLQFYVPINLIWPLFQRKLPEDLQKSTTINSIYRAALVSTTFIAAAVVPYLDLVISLVGAISSSFIALIFPPLVHLVTIWDDRENISSSEWIWIWIKGLAITLFGLAGSILGTYLSLVAIYEAATSETPRHL